MWSFLANGKYKFWSWINTVLKSSICEGIVYVAIVYVAIVYVAIVYVAIVS